MSETAYCMKCKHKVEVQKPEHIKMKNGNPAIKGTCAECGTKVFAIQKKK
jgi:RNase P subunit RPR2